MWDWLVIRLLGRVGSYLGASPSGPLGQKVENQGLPIQAFLHVINTEEPFKQTPSNFRIQLETCLNLLITSAVPVLSLYDVSADLEARYDLTAEAWQDLLDLLSSCLLIRLTDHLQRSGGRCGGGG